MFRGGRHFKVLNVGMLEGCRRGGGTWGGARPDGLASNHEIGLYDEVWTFVAHAK